METPSSKKMAKIQLSEFIQNKLKLYPKLRNYDFGNLDDNYASGLSPIITRRILSEEYIVRKVLAVFPFKIIEKFIQEICWRTYWKGYLEQYPSIWESYLKEIEIFNYIKDTRAYMQAVNGKTKIKCFNHWIRTLIRNNYLHNHSRMWFASIWSHTLSLPWQLGAEFFMEHLLDADPASNTLSWRWVVGLHTENKSYLARPDNIQKYTDGNFNPIGFLAEDISKKVKYIKYDKKDLNIKNGFHKKKLHCILIHENDLSLHHLPECDILLIQKTNYKRIKRGTKIKFFIDKCLEGCIKDAKNQFNAKIFTFEFEKKIKIKKLIQENNITTIHTPYPSIGYLKNEMMIFEKSLSIKFEYLYSKWDSLFWPHADKGFFKLKKQIPRILNKLETNIYY